MLDMARRSAAVAIAAACLLATATQAQYAVAHSAFVGGAGKLSGDSRHLLTTVGQAAAGSASGAIYTHRIGVRQRPVVLAAPALVAFAGANAAGVQPSLDWNDGFGAVTYTLEYADNSGFTSSTTASGITSSTYTFPSPLADGTYFWRVKALGAGTLGSALSSADSFVIIPLFAAGTLVALALAMGSYLWWRAR